MYFLALGLSAGRLLQIVNALQAHGPDSRVTFETFLPLLQDVSSKPIRDTVDDFVEGLKHFDKEGNGLISAVELRHLLTGLGEKMSEEEVESLIHGKEDSQVRYNLVFLGFNFNLIDRCGGGKARHEVYLWFPRPPALSHNAS